MQIKPAGPGQKYGDQFMDVSIVGDLIEAFHSRNGFSRNRMSAPSAEAFDREARAHLLSYADGDGFLNLGSVGTVTWGTIV